METVIGFLLSLILVILGAGLLGWLLHAWWKGRIDCAGDRPGARGSGGGGHGAVGAASPDGDTARLRRERDAARDEAEALRLKLWSADDGTATASALAAVGSEINELETSRARIAELETALNTARTRPASLTVPAPLVATEYVPVVETGRIDALENALGAARGEAEEARARVATLDARLEEVTAQAERLTEAETALAVARNEAAEAHARIAAFEQAAAAPDDIAAASLADPATMSDRTAHIAGLEEALEEARSRIADLSSDAAAGRIAELEEALETSRREAEASRADIAARSGDDGEPGRVGDLEEELAQARSRIGVLEQAAGRIGDGGSSGDTAARIAELEAALEAANARAQARAPDADHEGADRIAALETALAASRDEASEARSRIAALETSQSAGGAARLMDAGTPDASSGRIEALERALAEAQRKADEAGETIQILEESLDEAAERERDFVAASDNAPGEDPARIAELEAALAAARTAPVTMAAPAPVMTTEYVPAPPVLTANARIAELEEALERARGEADEAMVRVTALEERPARDAGRIAELESALEATRATATAPAALMAGDVDPDTSARLAALEASLAAARSSPVVLAAPSPVVTTEYVPVRQATARSSPERPEAPDGETAQLREETRRLRLRLWEVTSGREGTDTRTVAPEDDAPDEAAVDDAASTSVSTGADDLDPEEIEEDRTGAGSPSDAAAGTMSSASSGDEDSLVLPEEPSPAEQEARRLLDSGDEPGSDYRPAGLLASPGEDGADDLKRIRGVGAARESSLNEIGVYHYRQLSVMGGRDLAWLDRHIGAKGASIEGRWPSQATELERLRRLAQPLPAVPGGAQTLDIPAEFSAAERDALRLIESDTIDETRTPEVLLDAPEEGGADDLKEIRGIAHKLEALLNSLGIFHFRQIASLEARDIAWLDKRLKFRGRLIRDRWVAQAAMLHRRHHDDAG